jgi:signal transduction histidine kinase
VNAAREAVANAARHAGVGEISVYAEAGEGSMTAFIRDRGRGFHPEQIPADRKGIAESIRGRMSRHGGTAAIRSEPGHGTEVVLKWQA